MKVTPHNLNKTGMCCKTCSGRDVEAAEARFWERVAELGGRPAPGARYRGTVHPVSVICARGHRARPRPGSLHMGNGLCQECATTFDRIYLLAHPAAGAIKVGIASGEGRVTKHRAAGYVPLMQWVGVGHVVARAAERAVLERWRSQGHPLCPQAPEDGRTETAANGPATRAAAISVLEGLLGPATDVD